MQRLQDADARRVAQDLEQVRQGGDRLRIGQGLARGADGVLVQLDLLAAQVVFVHARHALVPPSALPSSSSASRSASVKS